MSAADHPGGSPLSGVDLRVRALESLPPQTCVTSSYCQLWLAKLERLLEQFGSAASNGATFTAADVGRVLARDFHD